MTEMKDRKRFEDILITLKMEEERTIIPGMQEGWKRQENGFFPVASRKNLALLTL